jgi:hypothetical protein
MRSRRQKEDSNSREIHVDKSSGCISVRYLLPKTFKPRTRQASTSSEALNQFCKEDIGYRRNNWKRSHKYLQHLNFYQNLQNRIRTLGVERLSPEASDPRNSTNPRHRTYVLCEICGVKRKHSFSSDLCSNLKYSNKQMCV